jgi:hypothetical protein
VAHLINDDFAHDYQFKIKSLHLFHDFFEEAFPQIKSFIILVSAMLVGDG